MRSFRERERVTHIVK